MDNTGDIILGFSKTETIYKALLKNVTEEQAHAQREGAGEWNIVEILCHMRDTEEIEMQRDQKMISEENPIIEGYDVEELFRNGDYDSETMENALNQFIAYRNQHLAMLEGISEEDWQRGGQHTSAGDITIFEHNTHMLAHDFDHAAQIARTIEGI